MRFDGVREAASGAEVLMFSIGKQETQILADLCKDAIRRTPKTFETQTFRQRCLNMLKCMGKTLGGKGFGISRAELIEPRK